MSEPTHTSTSENIQILNGNEIIIQGALEAGFSLYTGYPGSPLADYFNILYNRKDEFEAKGIKVVIANSEANAAAMASGAKQANRDCLVAMKSMGLHVASDALSVGNFANPGDIEIDEKTGKPKQAGVVVVVGDDPWSISTSTAADSRYLYKHLHIPFLEPSTPQELKDWMKVALEISRNTSVYQGVLLTTYMAEGGGRISLGDEVKVDGEKKELDTSAFDLGRNVMVPPNSLNADVRMIKERFPRVYDEYARLNMDQTFGDDQSEFALISAGTIFETLKQVLEETNQLDHIALYKAASSYPLNANQLLPFLKGKKHLCVVEEKRGFLEQQLKEFIQENKLEIKVYGKSFDFDSETIDGFPAYGGLSYEIIQEKLNLLFGKIHTNYCEHEKHQTTALGMALPRRLPTFCPGCPHRETLSLLKQLRVDLKEKNIDLVTHGDVGCYSLSFLPPFKEMHNLSAMGQGGALGAGVDLFTKNPSVVLMGDSTFFHSGLTDISNSVQCGHDITYILLDNDNTAMTGHQMTPASGVSVDGQSRPRQSMLQVVQGLGVTKYQEVNPSDRYFYKNLLEEFVLEKGVKVIVSNKECALTFHGREKRKERKVLAGGQTVSVKNFYHINTDACEDCRACVENTGCPGLSQTQDAYGTKVMIDPQICVADSYCTKIKACPSFELVEVLDYHPTKYQQTKSHGIENWEFPMPDQRKSFESIASGDDWRCVVTGVGGSGVTTVSRVLAEAALKMDGRDDLDFKFVDQKGLAQRNGNVTGHMAIYRKGKSYGVPTPVGTADLYVSPDLLDGSQHLQFLNKEGLVVIDDDMQVPLSILLDSGEDKPSLERSKLQKQLKEKFADQLAMYDFKFICSRLFGKSVYASAMILGVAFQKGALPFTYENMQEAFKKTMKKGEFENNWHSFQIGRGIVHHGMDWVKEKLSLQPQQRKDVAVYLKSLKESFLPWQSTGFLMKLFDTELVKLEEMFPEIEKRHLSQYLHDIYLYDRGRYSSQFLSDAMMISQFYKTKELKAMALRTLARTYFIKDEVFVAHQMISPLEKLRKDRLFKNIGSEYHVTHINRPHFEIFGMEFEFDINPKDWMLKLMRHMRILRAVMPKWHRKEKAIAKVIRYQIIDKISKMPEESQYTALKKLENIKGYRDVRYAKAKAKIMFHDDNDPTIKKLENELKA